MPLVQMGGGSSRVSSLSASRSRRCAGVKLVKQFGAAVGLLDLPVERGGFAGLGLDAGDLRFQFAKISAIRQPVVRQGSDSSDEQQAGQYGRGAGI